MVPKTPFSLGGTPRSRGLCPICSQDVPVTKSGLVTRDVHLDPVTQAACAGRGLKALPLPKAGA